ncbi:MAG: lipoyl(octanoyl) transferase LipB [Candidatus Synoicihabitans palmerolidicus]|nr:lipoyl(octanoyl) transferase LipB [Candidatus Synoicihabitans palmerolidicus]
MVGVAPTLDRYTLRDMSGPVSVSLQIIDWARTTYPVAIERQRAMVADRMAGMIPDTLVFTEHDPVYTVGLRTGAAANVLWDPLQLAAQGITVAETNRGGDITYHGPGQIVGYPIVDLSAVKDLHAYLRFLEEVMIRAVASFGLVANRREGLTGIWIGSRKIAAIGVAVRRWVAYHGFALNVSPDLNHFAGIVPCGIASSEGTVTSLASELPNAPSLAQVREVLTHEFTTLWPECLTPSAP